ncbi:hypothetical protein ACFOWU_09495 [Epilithonimonas zeae]|uniref:Uncharacterized protein n=1 Tax=Epilithonimonas zeae TaxID=1416779 RepID=A0A1N6GQ26_9FLAO|nr:hypothetical protein [Epilithonimonas zeae]SIO09641.1 hypothetical protein SAMN05444409_1981 [Epilithonimonas zeae]
MKKELSFYNYTQLNKEDQYDLVFREGEFIDSSLKNDVKFVLYKLYDFYVEIVYDFEENKILNLTSFLKSE